MLPLKVVELTREALASMESVKTVTENAATRFQLYSSHIYGALAQEETLPLDLMN